MDMNDMVNFIEKTSEVISDNQYKIDKIQKDFNLYDLLKQLKEIKRLGGLSTIANVIPHIGNMRNNLQNKRINDNLIIKQEAIIKSMTKEERKNPKILNASRKLRIARGSGTKVEEINKLLMHFINMKNILKQLNKQKIKNNKKKELNFKKIIENKIKKQLL